MALMPNLKTSVTNPKLFLFANMPLSEYSKIPDQKAFFGPVVISIALLWNAKYVAKPALLHGFLLLHRLTFAKTDSSYVKLVRARSFKTLRIVSVKSSQNLGLRTYS